MIKPIAGGAPPITSETAPSLARRRTENYRRAAVARIVGEASSIDPDASTGANAFALLAARHYQLMMDSNKPRIDDLVQLRSLMTGLDNLDQYAPADTTHTYTIDEATRGLLERLLAARPALPVVDGAARDVGP